MAVAAYASLVSLTHVLDNLHYRAPFQLPCLDIKQIETLQENVQSLLEFVEHHSKRKCPKIEDLWSQMTEVAFLAEETIDFHVVNLLHKRSQGETSDDTELSAVCEDMKRLISNTHYIKQELPAASIEKEEDEEAEEEEVQVGKQRTASVPVNVSLGTSSRNVVVGFDKHVDRIMDVLTRRHELDLHILPIVGMGGMGKTTLARTVYDHKYIIDSFDRRLWITISQEYSTEQILRGLLDEGGNIGTSENSAKLGERLYKRLYGRRYLIVMDDVWTSKAWDELKTFFPNNGNGSRVLLTTRLSNVVDLPGSLNPHSLSFLDEHHSWDLFCRTTFGQIGCPYDELAQIGRHIAKKCRGLPLAIVVIGRLLASSNTTREYWEFVAKNMNSLANLGDDERCLKILQLSYENLSIHLKPCFLYMRVFPEDAKVEISRLISLWIAEGYIKLVSNKSMEETAHEYFKELIDRNLIFINMSQREYCGIHDLLRDLCFRESHKECFLGSPKVQYINHGFRSGWCFLCEKRLTKKEREDLPKPVNIFPSSSRLSLNRCVCNACETLYSHRRKPRFVRTLDCIGKDKTEIVQPLIKRRSRIEKTIVQPLGLRYWYVSIRVFYQRKYVSISRVHLLWNLQTMKLSSTELDPIVLPPEIWEMPQLRVVDVSYKVLLPNPVGRHIEGENQDFIVLKNLHTLSSVQNFKCTKEILDRIPNLKELEIDFRYKSQGVSSESLNFFLYNLERLEKLEALDVTNALESIAFPNSLKRLGLLGCAVSWEEMSIVGSLPNLEELHMIQEGQGSEWNPVEGEFLKLRSLDLTSPDLVWWRADAIHFPVLEELRLCDLNLLEEIPSGIGDIPTLQSITLEKCNDSVINSGKQIWEEQQDMGNEDLKLYIGSKQYEISATKPNDSDS